MGLSWPRWATSLGLATWQALETPANGERCWRPFDDLPRLGIFAGGEFNEEATVESVGNGPRGSGEVAGGSVCGPAAQHPLLFRQYHCIHKVRPWSDLPLAVGLNQKGPAIGAEFKAVGADTADFNARVRVVEAQFAACFQLLFEFGREDAKEGPGKTRFHDPKLERRASRRVRYIRGDWLVPSPSEQDQADK